MLLVGFLSSLHWPGLAVSNREFSTDWCKRNWMPVPGGMPGVGLQWG